MTDPTRPGDDQDATRAQQPGRAGNVPAFVGGFRIVRELGRGGYGVVYEGFDDQLNRPVAVKVPKPELVRTEADAAPYRAEARTVARLEHPNIVTVYAVGESAEHPFFIVSRYVDGSDLARRMKDQPLTPVEAAGLVATVAAALHFAHTCGVVHRDVKPANLLLSGDGTPFVGDFGVALREEEVGRGSRYVGTWAYMSPEQARGEAHRVDGRSDVFSLGVVLYELLTGRRPFRGDTRDELLQLINDTEPRPPRQIRDDIPRELERICLRALAKRVSERYTTAADLADDLRHFLPAAGAVTAPAPPRPADATPNPTPATPAAPPSDTGPVAVVPKGLRSFDAADAEFFLSLVPGPRGRDGLPDGLRFWKRWAETTDTDDRAGVGLLYGPSGCGKTSLVRAGLIPRLAPTVTAVYLEATPADTEPRLLAALRRQVPGLPSLGLVETLTALRQGQFLPAGRSVLIVLDQFEQWLHAHPAGGLPDLARALRQCDGDRLRCVLMVRDDFWLAVSRFMRAVEVPIKEDKNARLVDLFDPPHARKVLTAFGRAYERLPDGPLSAEQAAFLDRAVDGLAEGGKVVSVRLALFAQMVKGKEWTPATLDAVGGAHGVGVAFLEEAFAGPSAPLPNRVHATAAQGVLAALLPDGATGIKGHRRSEAELLAISGYAGRPTDFAELLRTLDADLRLITPTDSADAPDTGRHYQLTHDYLVPSLREWLTRKQRETRRGRAELLLAERAGEWAVRPGRRWLPTLGEWLAIRLRTQRRTWTDSQKQMMAAGATHHGLRVGLWAAAVLLAGGLLFAGVSEVLAQRNAVGIHDQLLKASVTELPTVLKELEPYRPRLQQQLLAERATETDPARLLKLSLALLPADTTGAEANYLYGRMVDQRTSPDEFLLLRRQLAPHAPDLLPLLWSDSRSTDPGTRFRAACALAEYDPQNAGWAGLEKPTIAALLVQNPAEVQAWADLLTGVKARLLPPLADAITALQSDPAIAKTAADVFKKYAGDGAADYGTLTAIADVSAPAPKPNEKIDELRKRANAAAALIACGQGEAVWGFLKHSPDPTLRSLLVERLAAVRTPPAVLTEKLFKSGTEVSIRRALLLAIGSYPPDYPIGDEDKLLTLFATDPDAGIHGASEWAARRRGLTVPLPAATAGPVGGRQWFVNNGGMTLSVVPKGTLPLDGGKRTLAVDDPFAIGTKEVTRKQWFDVMRWLPDGMEPNDLPISNVTWYQMAEFCNALSFKEGMWVEDVCYMVNPTGEYAPGMTVLDHRGKKGYRLPTLDEWEYAGRAGGATPWYFGADEKLTPEYARYYENANQRPPRLYTTAQLKPNAAGLFDIHGNVSERAHPTVPDHIQPPDGSYDHPTRLLIGSIDDRKAFVGGCGGRVVQHARELKFGLVIGELPTNRDWGTGLRIARSGVRR